MGDTTFNVTGASVGLDWTSPYDNLSLMLSIDYMKSKLKPRLTLSLGTRIKTDFGHQRSPLEVLQNLAQDRGALASLMSRPGVTLSDPSAHGTENAIGGDYQENVVMPLGWEFLHLALKLDALDTGVLTFTLPEVSLGVEWVNFLGNGQLNLADKPGKEICTTGVADPNGTPKGPGSEASAPPKICKTGAATPVAPNTITRDENKAEISRRVGVGISSNFTTTFFSFSIAGGYYGVGDRNGSYVTTLLDFHAPEKATTPATLIVTLENSEVEASATRRPAFYTANVNQAGTLVWWIVSKNNRNQVIAGSPNHDTQLQNVRAGQNSISVDTGTVPVGSNYEVRFTFTPKDDATDTKDTYMPLEITQPAPVVDATELSAEPTATATAGDKEVIINVKSNNKTGEGSYKFMVASVERTGTFRIASKDTDTAVTINNISDLPPTTYDITFEMPGAKSATTTLTINPEVSEITDKAEVEFSLKPTKVSLKGKVDIKIATNGLFQITVADKIVAPDDFIIEKINYDHEGNIIIPNPNEKDRGINARIVRLNLAKISGLEAGRTYDVVVTPVGKSADTLKATTKQFTVSGRTGTTGRRGTSGK